jgi:hypothetical protein
MIVRERPALAGVMQMKVPAGEHRLVALAVMETSVRYSRVLQQCPQCLAPVLQTFLGDRGIGHPDKVWIIPCLRAFLLPVLHIPVLQGSLHCVAHLPGRL